MKKLLSIIFAFVFAFSAATVAFAASNTCPYCEKVITSETDYNKHLASECPTLYGGNTYYCTNPGCPAHFKSQERYYEHLEICPMKVETNRDKVEAFFLDLDLAEIMAKVNELLAKINFSDLLIKLIDLVEGAI